MQIWQPGFSWARRVAIAAAAFVAVIAALKPAVTQAGEADEAFAHLYVNVRPNINITAIPQRAEEIQDISGSGRFALTANFNVLANSDRLELGCAASDLFAAAVPGSERRIELSAAMGCEIRPEYAGTLGGHTNRAVFDTGTTVEVGGFDARPTNMIAFESAQAEGF
ncbi:MAG: hypothetical protein WBN40_06005, partial [Pseudomonadales bacterium]